MTSNRETWVAVRRTRTMDSKHRDVASKVASMLEAVVAATRNQTTVVDKISAIWKTTISAPAMHRAADRDAAVRIANS